MTERSGAQISDRTLDALRSTAAITAAVPNVAAQIRDADGVVVEVRRPPFTEADHPMMTVCAFRRAVVAAGRMRREGKDVAMHGLDAAQQPTIDWGFSGEGCVLSGGILRLRRGEQWWHLAAVASAPALVSAALAGVSVDVGVSLHADDELGATVLYVRTPAGDERVSARTGDAMITAIAAIGVADLEARLGLPATDATGPWVAGCTCCGEIDVSSMWPRPEHVAPRQWRCTWCLSSTWEPVPARLPDLG